MKYFRDNNGEIWGLDDQQIADGYADGMTPLTDEETEAHINPPISQSDILWNNTNTLKMKTDEAAKSMALILMAMQLGDATDEESVKARAWQDYYRSLQTVDLTIEDPQWPQAPE